MESDELFIIWSKLKQMSITEISVPELTDSSKVAVVMPHPFVLL